MKPIRLVLEGLNSFKEKQELCFASICDGRVFGIFGPTGSGKSTIIDAITLALYGKVERAQRGVQGIINKSGDSASVLFEFELGAADGRKVYRVERKYISKNETISCRLARLIELAGSDEIVLADKPSHVDEQVKKILGLTVDDFTRAVVLPQGKFAEFLGLKGTQRREMLERIFNLSDYGERLMSLASAELKEVDSKVRSILSEQQGLGQADKHAVLQAETEMEKAQAAAQTARDLHDKALAEKDKARTVVQLQDKLAEAEQSLAVLEIDSHKMAVIEDRLVKLSAAEKAEPHAQAYVLAESSLKDARSRFSRAEEKQSSLLPGEKQCTVDWQNAVQKRQQQEPLLLSRQRDLERALILDEKAEVAASQETALRAEQERLTASLKKLTEELSIVTEQGNQTTRELSQLALEVTANEVKLEQRAALEEALSLDMVAKQSAQRVAEIQGDILTKSQGLTEHREILTEMTAKSHTLEANHLQAASQLAAHEKDSVLEVTEEMYTAARQYSLRLQQVRQKLELKEQEANRVAAVTNEISMRKTALAKLEEERSQLNEKLDLARRELVRADQQCVQVRHANMAAILAKDLVRGESCPVCGSSEHPSPQEKEEYSSLAVAEAAVLHARSVEQEVLQATVTWTERRNSLAMAIEEYGGQLDAAETKLISLLSEIEELVALFPAQWQAVPICLSALTDHVLNYEESLGKKSAAYRQYIQLRDELHQQYKASGESLSGLRHEVSLVKNRIESLETELASLTHKEQEALAKAQSSEHSLKRSLEELGTANLAQYRNMVHSKDKRYQEVSTKYKSLESSRNLYLEKRQELEQQLTQLKGQVATISAQYASCQEQRGNLIREIAEITHGGQVASLLTRVKEQLKQLKSDEEQRNKALEQVRFELQITVKELAAATEAHALAQEQVNKTSLEQQRALRITGFASAEDVLQALEHLPHRDEWEQELKSYRNARALALGQADRLRNELAGKRMSKEDWELIVEQFNVAQASYEEAGVGLGHAQSVLVELKKRHERWDTLESERVALAKKQGLLAELSSLLRGNALVEFMATEQLQFIAGEATQWLRLLTHNRYALEVDADGGFVIRDDGDGGLRRPVHTLSGGETFIASLALALALSAQIQLRGLYPLEFFFLDEGFGTLDPELLDVVMNCLERMQGQRRSIGIISHVPELRERIQRKVLVTPAERGGRGSRLTLH